MVFANLYQEQFQWEIFQHVDAPDKSLRIAKHTYIKQITQNKLILWHNYQFMKYEKIKWVGAGGSC